MCVYVGQWQELINGWPLCVCSMCVCVFRLVHFYTTCLLFCVCMCVCTTACMYTVQQVYLARVCVYCVRVIVVVLCVCVCVLAVHVYLLIHCVPVVCLCRMSVRVWMLHTHAAFHWHSNQTCLIKYGLSNINPAVCRYIRVCVCVKSFCRLCVCAPAACLPRYKCVFSIHGIRYDSGVVSSYGPIKGDGLCYQVNCLYCLFSIFWG